MPYSHRFLLLGLALLLSACVGLRSEEKARPLPAAAETTPGSRAQAQAAPTETPLIARRTVDDDVRQLLKDAEEAMAADRLTTPLHDNAFDRFQAVLLLRRDNEQARSGLQLIFTRYMSLARDALAKNQTGAARAFLERARLVDREHPMLQQLAADISKVQQRLAQAGGQAAEEKEILLDTSNLDRRAPSVVQTLQDIAVKVKESDETLLIVARSDAEGRWIYQRMSEGVPDYRLRGDIRLGREPKILLLPPID